MAKVLDKVTLVRTVHHSMKNHNLGGVPRADGTRSAVDDIRSEGFDRVVSGLRLGRGSDRSECPRRCRHSFALPHVIRDGSVTPGQHASFLGKRHDPLLITADPNDSGFKLPELSLPSNLSADRLQSRREMQRIISQQTRLLEYSATARGIERILRPRAGDAVVVARPRCVRSVTRAGEDS